MPRITTIQTDTEFGEWMRKNMLDNDLNSCIVARMPHTTKQTILNHVKGRVPPNYAYVMAYCKIFGDKDDPEEIWKLVKNEAV